MTIGMQIVGDREVALKFEEFPEQARQSLLSRITALTNELEDRVQSDEPVRTGKLRGSTAETVRDGENAIIGRVAIDADFAKAGALEYGAHGTAQVRAHQARLSHVFARATEMTVAVEEHARRLNIAEHRFLRGPLAGMESEVLSQLEDALEEATQK